MTVQFQGTEFTQAYQYPPQAGADYTSESFEWTSNGETVENWSKLLTTHKLTPLNPGVLLSAEAYAQNLVGLNQERGAVILETSVINTPDAVAAAGLDQNNPPYILAYVFSGVRGLELNIQKVINGDNGTVNATIYAQHFGTETELQRYLESEAFANTRLAVIQVPFPY